MSESRSRETAGETGNHPSEETLELYAMRRLEEAEEARLEEHLLLCEECRERLQAADDYVRAMRTALAELEEERNRQSEGGAAGWKPRVRLPKLAWAGALAAAVAVTVLVRPPKGAEPAPVEVQLAALRGEPAQTRPAVTEGRPLTLRLDAGGVETPPPYEVRVVDADGEGRLTVVAAPEQGILTVMLPEGLPAGRYWVRIFPPGGAETPLREFGFTVE